MEVGNEWMSHLWKYVKLMKSFCGICQSYDGVCQSYEGLLTLWRFVNLMNVCQTYEGMSNLWGYVTIMIDINVARFVRILENETESWDF